MLLGELVFDLMSFVTDDAAEKTAKPRYALVFFVDFPDSGVPSSKSPSSSAAGSSAMTCSVTTVLSVRDDHHASFPSDRARRSAKFEFCTMRLLFWPQRVIRRLSPVPSFQVPNQPAIWAGDRSKEVPVKNHFRASGAI